MKQSRAKLLLFLLISAVAIPLLVIALQKFNILTPRASGAVPQLLTVSNLTDTTASISWTTSTASTLTNLQWGESTLLGTIETDFRDKRDKSTKARMTHYVQLTGLQPNTTYYYRIVSGDATYPDPAEAPSSFKTLPRSTGTQPPALSVYGDISTQDTDVILSIYVPGKAAYANIIPMTAVLNTDGTWLFNIGGTRNTDGSYINPDDDGEIAVLAVGPNGLGSIQKTKATNSPISMKLEKALTQSDLDSILLSAPSQTATPTTTATPTPTKGGNQDVPLVTGGATSTPTTSVTPTTTITQLPESSITKDELLASFASPSVSNVTDTSLSIMFMSSSPVIGTLNWGTAVNLLNSNRLDDRDNAQAMARHIHHYTLTGLTANKQYFFKPTADPTTRTFTTPSTISAPSGQTIITGSLTNGVGECIVRTQIKRNSILSSVITTLPNSLNTWAVNIMPVRTSTLDTYMIPVATDTVLTNAICFNSADIYYQAHTTTVQNAVTSGVSLTLTKLMN